MKNLARVMFITGVLGITLARPLLADEVVIPFPIKQKMFVREMAKHGMDLKGTDDSDGEVGYGKEGFRVITYKPVSFEQLDTIKEVAFKCIKDKSFDAKHNLR